MFSEHKFAISDNICYNYWNNSGRIPYKKKVIRDKWIIIEFSK